MGLTDQKQYVLRYVMRLKAKGRSSAYSPLALRLVSDILHQFRG